MVLESLYKELRLKDNFQKSLVSAMVYSVLQSNKCYGMKGNPSEELRKEVKDALMKDVCDSFQFEVMLCAAYWGNDCEDLLKEELGLRESIFKRVFKWLETNEVVHGVGNCVCE